jgi:hypothetical protein
MPIRPFLAASVTRERVIVGSETTAAVVGLVAEDGEAQVVAVGETPSEFVERCKGLVSSGELKELPSVVLPGESSSWDKRWQSKVPWTPAEKEKSFLFIQPLRRETWSQPIVEVLLKYAIVMASKGPFLRPKISLEVSPDFDLNEYGQIVDAARACVGFQVKLPKGRPRERLSILGVIARLTGPAAWVVGVGALLLPILNEPAPARIKMASAFLLLVTLVLVRLGPYIRRRARFHASA